jgi:hypothetical protein
MFNDDFYPATATLEASLTIATPVWEWMTLPAFLTIAPPPTVSIPAYLTTSAKNHETLEAFLFIRQTKPGVLFTELNHYKGPYDSFQDQLAAAMGGSGQAEVVAEQFMAGAKAAPENGVP